MRIVRQSHKIIKVPEDAVKDMEGAARICYQSEGDITETSAPILVKKLLKKRHDAMIEFSDIWVNFITNRGVTHELVRHRIPSYAQESSRYCVYKDEVQFIQPVWWDDSSNEQKRIFLNSCKSSEEAYLSLLKSGWSAQKAREVLPNALKTQILVKTNVREWRHILMLRCSNEAHPQMRALMRNVLKEFYGRWPLLFEDIHEKYFGKLFNSTRNETKYFEEMEEDE